MSNTAFSAQGKLLGPFNDYQEPDGSTTTSTTTEEAHPPLFNMPEGKGVAVVICVLILIFLGCLGVFIIHRWRRQDRIDPGSEVHPAQRSAQRYSPGDIGPHHAGRQVADVEMGMGADRQQRRAGDQRSVTKWPSAFDEPRQQDHAVRNLQVSGQPPMTEKRSGSIDTAGFHEVPLRA